MELKPQLKRTAIAITLAAVIWTGSAWSVSTAFAATNAFSDVQGHWAEKHISKLALQDILRGSEGKFRPNDSIRREDAVLVALRFMGLADNVNLSGSIAFPASFQVDDYYKPYIMEAFKQKILLAEEEYELANQEKGKGWGKSTASREWVARLLVRAIGKEAEAAGHSGQSTSFSDDDKIDAKLRPYVLTAVEQGLVTGVTPTKFDPISPITRAAIAKLFSQAESKVSVSYSGQVSGTLLSVSPQQIVLMLADGSRVNYQISAQTSFYRMDKETQTDIGSLKPFGKVTVIGEAGTALYVEQTDDTQALKTVEGRLVWHDAVQSQLSVIVDNTMKTYHYDAAHKPTVMTPENTTLSLGDLVEGATVKLMVDTIPNSENVVSIVQQKSSVGGRLNKVNPVDKTIQYYVGSKLEAKVLSGNVTVSIPGVTNATVADLLPDDTIQLSFDADNYVTSITVSNRNIQFLQAVSIISYIPELNGIVIKDSLGSSKLLYLRTNTRYDSDGAAMTTDNGLTMVINRYKKVNLSYSGDSVVAVSFVTKYTGTVAEINTTARTLKLTLEGNQTVILSYFNPSVEIFGTNSASIANIRNGDVVTVSLSSSLDSFTSLTVSKTISYQVLSVNTNLGTMRVTRTGGDGYVEDWTMSSFIGLQDSAGNAATLSSFAAGNTIQVTFKGNLLSTIRKV